MHKIYMYIYILYLDLVMFELWKESVNSDGQQVHQYVQTITSGLN
jgi:hypothetical protein